MSKKPRENRVPIMMSAEELRAIDDWRFARRIATRSDAIRRLCKIGLLMENEYEQIVDVVSDGVTILDEDLNDALIVHTEVLGKETKDLLFTREEVRDLINFHYEKASRASVGMKGLKSMVVTLYNVLAAFVDSSTLQQAEINKRGWLRTAKQDEARVHEELEQERENRLLTIAFSLETDESRSKYLALSEDEQEKYWSDRVLELRREEDRDPAGFAERYHHKPFWEKPGWAADLRQKIANRGDQ